MNTHMLSPDTMLFEHASSWNSDRFTLVADSLVQIDPAFIQDEELLSTFNRSLKLRADSNENRPSSGFGGEFLAGREAFSD